MESFKRYSLLIEYDGTNYSGWQIQNNQATIQKEIEKALKVIYRKDIRITGAGRTDTGVHARGQVAHFDYEGQIETVKAIRSLNGLLPKDIRIKNCRQESEKFHSRFSAKERNYCYFIKKEPTVLLRRYSWFVSFNLNLEKMQKASDLIVGKHNFQSFCKVKSDVKHHVCEIREATWIEEDNMLIFNISADRFLHGMVRALVGTLVDVGNSKITIENFKKIIKSGDRTKASQAAPARGLVLERIQY